MKNLISKTMKITGLFCFLFFIFSCSKPESDKFITVSKHFFDLEDSTFSNKIKGDAHTGDYFSRADSTCFYGVGTIFTIPDSLINKNIYIKLNAWARIGDLSFDKKYAMSLEDTLGNCIHWTCINLKKHVKELSKWTQVSDSVMFSGTLLNKTGLLIKTYSFNPDGKSTLDCDDVELTFSILEKPKKQ
jgi:hypothetical protein